MATEHETRPFTLHAGSHASTAPPGGPACFVSIYGPSVGTRWSLDRLESIIGRDGTCDVPLPIETVSRRHCRIRVSDGDVLLTDLGSTNGTALNDEALVPNEEFALRSGDKVRVGSAVLKFLRGEDIDSLYQEEVYRTMVADGLTGAANRRFLTEFLAREMVRSRRHHRTLALVRFDVDDFKQVNDRFGHLTGDEVLRTIAAIAREQVRREDCFARISGEEFAVVLTETDLRAARLFSERLRGTIEHHEFRAGNDRLAVTISSGIACVLPETGEPEELLSMADARLDEAKAAGRNRTAG